ncbi:Na+/H+ antiporter subunit E, partial [Bordetella pertussis]
PGLAARVFADIVRSNVAVARLVWQRRPDFSPGFIAIPLDLHDPHGLAILACIVTYTPGTVWVDIIDGKLVLHVLDLQNEEAWIALVKQRYERTLIEVFE